MGRHEQIETPLPPLDLRARHMATGAKKMVADRSAGVSPSRFPPHRPTPPQIFQTAKFQLMIARVAKPACR